MATSKIQIWNMALSRIGVKDFIIGENEASDEASVMNIHYDEAVRKTLTDFPWPFARGYFILNLVEERPNGDWAFSYRYPSVAMRIRRILRPEVGFRDADPPPFVIGGDDTARLVYTNREQAEVEITRPILDVAKFSEQFTDVLAWYLAWQSAPSLARIPNAVQSAQSGYLIAASNARVVDANEVQQEEPHEAEWIQER